MRIAVVGGGILGVAVANRLTSVRPDAQVTLLEKEHKLAAHQTGHNSGVVHAGIYYAPGSLKAQLCRRGVGLLRALCVEEGIAYDECGKLVVALTEDELPRLDELERRATANGVPGLRRVSAAEIRDIEPHAVGVAALHSPETAIVDFVAVTHAIADRARQAGAEILTGREVTGITRVADGVVLQTADGDEWPADLAVVCGGLQSDRLAVLAGDSREPQIVPFRGEYYQLRPDRRHLVRGLIYPVPDPRFPFLGIHLTKHHDGEVLVGPNAVLALAREGYRWRKLSSRDLAGTLGYKGFRKLARRYWRTGASELWGSCPSGLSSLRPPNTSRRCALTTSYAVRRAYAPRPSTPTARSSTTSGCSGATACSPYGTRLPPAPPRRWPSRSTSSTSCWRRPRGVDVGPVTRCRPREPTG